MSIAPPDRRQALRLRRSLLAAAGCLAFTAVIVLAWSYGYVRLDGWGLAVYLAVLWSGNLLILLTLRTGLNRRFADPSLTWPQLAWAIVSILGIALFLDELRPLVLFYCLLVLSFAPFQLDRRELTALAAGVIATYAVVVAVVVLTRPDVADVKVELIVLAGFAITVLGFIPAGHEMHRLREVLRERNRDLRAALDRVSELAVRDELTGLHNRRHLLEMLDAHRMLAVRGGHAFAIGFADLDHFKAVNDAHGHEVGDRVLARFAELGRGLLRDTDAFARFGGEEFVMVLVQTSLGGALDVAERVRVAVETADFSDLAPGLALTVSIGVTDHRPPEPIETTLARGDAAMYRAKRRGRNRVEPG